MTNPRLEDINSFLDYLFSIVCTVSLAGRSEQHGCMSISPIPHELFFRSVRNRNHGQVTSVRKKPIVTLIIPRVDSDPVRAPGSMAACALDEGGACIIVRKCRDDRSSKRFRSSEEKRQTGPWLSSPYDESSSFITPFLLISVIQAGVTRNRPGKVLSCRYRDHPESMRNSDPIMKDDNASQHYTV